MLRRAGVLGRFVEPAGEDGYRYAADWRGALDLLAAVGGADLSLARLLEGHLNALQLVALHGDPGQRRRVARAVEEGAMLGVWGADGEAPLRIETRGGGGMRLVGAKRYASGTGLLRLALVPLTEPDGRMRLLLLDVSDPARADASPWNMRGMRASLSGSYDFTGLVLAPGDIVGNPDDYRREPYFVGGIWRCCAAQLGAIEAIVAAMAGELKARGRDAHPLQMARIGEAILQARGARLWVEDAARRVEEDAARDPGAVAEAVALSAYGRLATEKAAMAVIALAERALGLGSFALGHPVEALSRDLAVYVRQADPDAVLLQHGRVLAERLAP